VGIRFGAGRHLRRAYHRIVYTPEFIWGIPEGLPFRHRYPRKIYSNNEFGATEGESSGFADSAAVGLVGWATGCADIRLRNRKYCTGSPAKREP
jgi:hypothetical protein